MPPTFPATAPAASPAPALKDAAPWWPYFAGGAAGLAGLVGLLWWQRRRSALHEPQVEFETPVVAPPKPAQTPAPIPGPGQSGAPASLPKMAPEMVPAPAPQPQGLVLALEATRLSASLMATTLSYRLTLTNHSAETIAALAIEGDMVSAHASLPPEKQMAQAGQALELRHALAALAPGESAELTGDIRLPLAAITAIRAGEQAYFVPLARFRVEAAGPGGAALVIARTFVVGEVADGPQTTLRPFRLDLGARTYSRISQRELDQVTIS